MNTEKTIKIELNEKELSHLINDVIAKMWQLEDRCSDKADLEMCGYYSRKELKEKLRKIEKEEFPKLDCCC